MWLPPSPVPLDHLMKASEMVELVEMVTIITTKNKFCLIYIHYVVIGELVFFVWKIVTLVIVVFLVMVYVSIL